MRDRGRERQREADTREGRGTHSKTLSRAALSPSAASIPPLFDVPIPQTPHAVKGSSRSVRALPGLREQARKSRNFVYAHAGGP